MDCDDHSEGQDPNPARHPHVHLTVKTAGLDGTRLNPRKPDLQRWREGFAEALQEQGIEATTTSRLHRTTHERWTIRRGVDPITKAKQIDRRLRATPVPPVQREVMQNYARVMKALGGLITVRTAGWRQAWCGTSVDGVL